MTEAQVHRYARQLVLAGVGGRGQRRLLSASVALEVGPHAPAAHWAIAYLAAAGVGRIELDGDAASPVTEPEVAGGPLLIAADVGTPRIEALGRRVAALNPDVTVAAAAGAPRLELDGAGEPMIAGGAAAARAIRALIEDESR
jgi:adenylyltransferase/sulfurtransferase